MNPIPRQLVEAINGALVPVLLVMVVLAARWLFRLWRDNGYRFRGVEADAKGAWAAALLFFGVMIKNDATWVADRMSRWDLGVPGMDVYANVAVVAGGLIILWASICWIRNIMQIKFSPWAWAWLAALSVAFGVTFAAY